MPPTIYLCYVRLAIIANINYSMDVEAVGVSCFREWYGGRLGRTFT
jgi:hypothetical protein